MTGAVALTIFVGLALQDEETIHERNIDVFFSFQKKKLKAEMIFFSLSASSHKIFMNLLFIQKLFISIIISQVQRQRRIKAL